MCEFKRATQIEFAYAWVCVYKEKESGRERERLRVCLREREKYAIVLHFSSAFNEFPFQLMLYTIGNVAAAVDVVAAALAQQQQQQYPQACTDVSLLYDECGNVCELAMEE